MLSDSDAVGNTHTTHKTGTSTGTGTPSVIPKQEAIALTILGFASQFLLTATIVLAISHTA